jgi:hypothetical protein
VLEQEKSDKANTEDEVDEEEHKYWSSQYFAVMGILVALHGIREI